jgi:hypothetical protein
MRELLPGPLSLLLALFFLLFLGSAASLIPRFLLARGRERQQLKWLTYAAALTGTIWVAPTTAWLGDWKGVVDGLVTLGVPTAIGVAILRHQLYDIDRLINRTVVYGALTALLGAAYAGAVLVLGQVFGEVGGKPPSWAVAGITLAVAALFRPARGRIQVAVDRRFNRRKYHAAKTIETFSARLRDQIDLDTLSSELLAVVDQTMEPTRVSFWLRPPPPGSPGPGGSAPRPTTWSY